MSVSIQIRPLEPGDDRLAVGRVYVKSWRHAYRGIVPQPYLDALEPDRWAASLDAPPRRSLVMLDGGRIVGTASFGPARLDGMAGFGELISIYLLPAYAGRGFGAQLLRRALDGLRELGFREVYLWVLEENRRARRFYEAHGFAPSGCTLEDCIGGKPLREVQYRYRIS
ncbi:GNAT family N-acetyltransferase [Feifania hominis]|uniref:GNAT family N-acetyltransferase n=1 Tax=Feifania hominis TaxID=2763660 RepID=UPI0020160D08|nr:GNAT family N-acetyltransferase [Feifania hominis]